MPEGITVSQLAEQISDPEIGGRYDRNRILRQLRHWTASGVLKPIGGAHTGIGRHRRYGEECALTGAILIELAALGLQVGTLLSAATAIADTVARTPIAGWRERLRSEPAYLRLSFDPMTDYGFDVPQVSVLAVLSPENLLSGSRGPLGICSVVIDLGRLVDRIGG